MYNCFCVKLNGHPFAYFKTEQAAENFVTMVNRANFPAFAMPIFGAYIEGIF